MQYIESIITVIPVGNYVKALVDYFDQGNKLEWTKQIYDQLSVSISSDFVV
jgi:hypothetical protein